MHKGLKIFFWLLFMVLLTGIGSFVYHRVFHTPDRILQQEAAEIAVFYNENLAAAMEQKKTADFVVVLNPVHGGTDKGYESEYGNEQDIVLRICQLVMERNLKGNVAVLSTRGGDLAIPDNLRTSFIKEVEPDLVIEVALSKQSGQENYGTAVYYTSEFYNRTLTNQQFADIMEKSVVTKIEGIAAGIFEAKKEDYPVLEGLSVPGISLSCGNLSNHTEAQLFEREGFLENVADGILDGIYDAMDVLNES